MPDEHLDPDWAGIALRLRSHHAPSGFVLVTMQMLRATGTVRVDEEYDDIMTFGAAEPIRRMPRKQTLTVNLVGELVDRNHWSHWQPERHQPSRREIEGRWAIDRDDRLALPGSY